MRQFDQSELVVGEPTHMAERRDWNGFVRKLRWAELERLSTAIFETEVLAFGPPHRLGVLTT